MRRRLSALAVMVALIGAAGATAGVSTASAAPIPIPAIAQVTPTPLFATGGTTLHVVGSGRRDVDLVRFLTTSGTLLADVQPATVSDTELTLPAPAVPAGTVVVRAVGGQVLSNEFPVPVVDDEPVIDSLSPTSGSEAGGNTVTLHGSHLGSAMTVHFGPVAAAFQVVDDATLTVIAPGGAGIVDVTVTSPVATSLPARYAYDPTLSSGPPSTSTPSVVTPAPTLPATGVDPRTESGLVGGAVAALGLGAVLIALGRRRRSTP